MLDSAIQWIDWIHWVALTACWKTGAWWTRVIFKSKECSLSLEYQIVKYQIMPLFPSKPGCLFTEECLKVFCFLYSRLLFVMTNTWTCTCSLTCLSSLNSVPQWTLPPVEGGVKRRMTSQTNELGSYSWILVQGGVRRRESLYSKLKSIKKKCSCRYWTSCLFYIKNLAASYTDDTYVY